MSLLISLFACACPAAPVADRADPADPAPPDTSTEGDTDTATEGDTDTATAVDTDVEPLPSETTAGCGGEADFSTITEAISSTADGGTVWVCGYHAESLVLTQSVVLAGADGTAMIEGTTGDATISSGVGGIDVALADLTVLGGAIERDAVLLSTNNVRFTVSGATLQGGAESAGLYADANGLDVSLIDTVVSSSASGIYAINTNALEMTLDGVTIEGISGLMESGFPGYGLRIACYWCSTRAFVTVQDSELSNNQTEELIDVGDLATVSLINTSVTDNVTENVFYVEALGLEQLWIEDSEVLRNTSEDSLRDAIAWIWLSELVSVNTDWGSGDTDNAPNDVWCGETYYSFGADASFTCTGGLGCY